MIRIIRTAADIRADETRAVFGKRQCRRQFAPSCRCELRDIAPRAERRVVCRGQAKRARLDGALEIDGAVLDAFDKLFQILDVSVGDVDLFFKQLGDLDSGVHLRDLQDLRRRCALAVDGDLAYLIAVCDAIRKSCKRNGLAVLADVEIDHLSFAVDKTGGIHCLQVLFCAHLVAAVKLGQRGHKHIRYACCKRGYGCCRDNQHNHYKRQKHTECFCQKGLFHVFPPCPQVV